jgi:hypothetical protein
MPAERKYVATIQPTGAKVAVEEEGKRKRQLPLFLWLLNKSPTGFAWGYGGSGPAQLAFALLYHVTRDKGKALEAYQDFKWQVIARKDVDKGWTMTSTEILEWLAKR